MWEHKQGKIVNLSKVGQEDEERVQQPQVINWRDTGKRREKLKHERRYFDSSIDNEVSFEGWVQWIAEQRYSFQPYQNW